MDKPTREQLQDPKWWDENAPEDAEFYSCTRFRKYDEQVEYFLDDNTWYSSSACDPIEWHLVQEDYAPRPQSNQPQNQYSAYFKDFSCVDEADVYLVHDRFNIQDASGCIQHASKKLLLSGCRTGGKSFEQDIREARDTLTRKLQLMGVE